MVVQQQNFALDRNVVHLVLLHHLVFRDLFCGEELACFLVAYQVHDAGIALPELPDDLKRVDSYNFV